MNILLKYFIYFLLGIIIYYCLFNSPNVGSKKLIEGFNTQNKKIFIAREGNNLCTQVIGSDVPITTFINPDYSQNFTQDPQIAFQLDSLTCDTISIYNTIILEPNEVFMTGGTISLYTYTPDTPLSNDIALPLWGSSTENVSLEQITSTAPEYSNIIEHLTNDYTIDERMYIYSFTYNAINNYIVFIDSVASDNNQYIFLFLDVSWAGEIVIDDSPQFVINSVNYYKIISRVANMSDIITITRGTTPTPTSTPTTPTPTSDYNITSNYTHLNAASIKNNVNQLLYKINITSSTPSIISNAIAPVDYIIYNYIYYNTIISNELIITSEELLIDGELLLGIFLGSQVGRDETGLHLDFGSPYSRGCENFICQAHQYKIVRTGVGERGTICDANNPNNTENYCGNFNKNGHLDATLNTRPDESSLCCEEKTCHKFFENQLPLSCQKRDTGEGLTDEGSVEFLGAAECIPEAVVGMGPICTFNNCCTTLPDLTVQKFFLKIVQFSRATPEVTALLSHTIQGRHIRDFIYYTLINFDDFDQFSTLGGVNMNTQHSLSTTGTTPGTGYNPEAWDALQDYIDTVPTTSRGTTDDDEIASSILNKVIPLKSELLNNGIDETTLNTDWIGTSSGQGLVEPEAMNKLNVTVNFDREGQTDSVTNNINAASIQKLIVLLDNNNEFFRRIYYFKQLSPLDASLKTTAGNGHDITITIHDFTNIL